MFKNQMNLAEWLTQASEASRKSLVILTGESGVGKTYLADLLVSQNKEKFVDIDSFGDTVEIEDESGNKSARWIVDPRALLLFLDEHPEVHVVCGTCDNFWEVIRVLASEWALSVYYVQAEPRLFKQIQAVKLDEGLRKKLPANWINGWRNKAAMSPERVRQMYSDSSWVYFASTAYGLRKASELNGNIELPPPPPTRFKAWAESLKPRKTEILDALAESLMDVGTVENSAAEDVKIAHGWHRSQSQVKPKFTK